MSTFKASVPYNNLPLLPPDPAKIETIRILKQETRAASAIAELKGIANIIPNQAILINAIVLQEAKDSSEIENIITTSDDLYKAVSSSISKVDSATKEVMFYREALYLGHRKIVERGLLSINDFIDIQSLVVRNNAGIRTTSGTALVNDATGLIVYTPPEGEQTIRGLLQNLTEYLNNDDASLVKVAILHYQFEKIHPFYDGNGRTGRIVNVLYLILKGYLDIPILNLSSYIIKNKPRYYELLSSITTTGQWEEWIIYMLKGIEVTAKVTIQKIKQIRSLLDETNILVKDRASKIYSKELVELLFVHPYCKIEFLTRQLKVERKAASRYLYQLEELGILELRKSGKENFFINKELMRILSE
jgi:Fic family protein